MNVDQYLGIFVTESHENLQNLNTQLLRLEQNVEDVDTINEIFRVAHTLKGMSGSMRFLKMQKLTHAAENVLSEIREGNIQCNSDILDVLFKCMDALETYIETIENTNEEGHEEYVELISELQAIITKKGNVSDDDSKVKNKNNDSKEKCNTMKMELESSQKMVARKAIEQGLNVFQVNVKLSDQCVLKAPRAFIVFKEFESMGELVKSVPSVKDIEDERFEDSFGVVLITKETIEEVKRKIENISDIQEVKVEPVVEDISKDNTEEQPSNAVATPRATESQNNDAKRKAASTTPSATNNVAKTVRVNIDRLDTLMNLVSELIIVKTQLEGIDGSNHPNYTDSIEYLERVSSSLHDAVMKVRMVPVENVFNRFPRMIRDIARKLDKDIELVMTGEETELDRTVVDEIGEPLIHLLRNAADHGLETKEERKAAGKTSKGQIRLEAYQDGNNVIIEVSDDGKGIDVNRIKEKALKNGAITQDELATMTEQEIIQLIFRPSFSTAEVVSDLSGRGVGLDVVKSKISTLGGSVEVRSEFGKGSTFLVKLPLTLAIIQALMVNIDTEKYAIPLSNIQTIETVNRTDIEHLQNQEVIVLRGEVIPLVRLNNLLELNEANESENVMVVIVKKGDRYVGFIIDSLIGQQEIVVKSLGRHLNNIDMIVGATILGNGEVTLILDINRLV